MDREPIREDVEQGGERPKAFLYIQSGVNEELTLIAREELKKQKIPFDEIDLTGQKLDEEWPKLPVISSALGFLGNLRDKETIEALVSLIY